MIYKFNLEDAKVIHDHEDAIFVIQNETHALYKFSNTTDLPESVEVLETFNDSDLPNIYANIIWQQPQPE